MLLLALYLLLEPTDGFYLVVLLLDISLLLYGFKMLVYFLTMARYMTGGIMTLYKSIIAIDLGLFVLNLEDAPKKLVMIYLICMMIFSGIIIILSAMEARKIDAPWKNRFIYGVVKLILALYCLCMWDTQQMVSVIYSAGLIHSAFHNVRLTSRKTALFHIR